MANITIDNNTFNDNSSVIKNLYEVPKFIDYARIERELIVIKADLEEESPAYRFVETLEQNCKDHKWKSICNTIKDFAFQFSSATLSHLLGSYLSELLGL